MAKVKKSLSRTEQRNIKAKFDPAIKAISSHLHNTGEIPDAFQGYKIPAGDIKDRRGRQWQIQIHAVCTRDLMMKRNEVKPMIKGLSIGLRVRIIIKHIVDWLDK